jgi:hypothetical protein
MTVYKTPTCGCCGKWVEYMRAAGFDVEVHDFDDLTPIKKKLGVPQAMSGPPPLSGWPYPGCRGARRAWKCPEVRLTPTAS